jgi:hypothetical protein
MDPKPETPGNGNAPEDPKVGKSEDSGSFTVEVPPTPEQLKAMTEAQKIERLKSFHLKLFPDQTLYSCYERAYDLISYFQIFQHVLEVIRDNIPKDKTTPLWKAARVFFKSFNTGFIAFWTAMREDMIYLRDNFKYASVTSIVLLPTDAPKPISGFDDEDEVIGDMSLPPSPSTEGKEKVSHTLGASPILSNPLPEADLDLSRSSKLCSNPWRCFAESILHCTRCRPKSLCLGLRSSAHS